jgi:hypothetical protein
LLCPTDADTFVTALTLPPPSGYVDLGQPAVRERVLVALRLLCMSLRALS